MKEEQGGGGTFCLLQDVNATTATSAICAGCWRNSNGGGSDGIRLITKLIEDPTLAAADKAAICVHAQAGWIGVPVCSRG